MSTEKGFSKDWVDKLLGADLDEERVCLMSDQLGKYVNFRMTDNHDAADEFIDNLCEGDYLDLLSICMRVGIQQEISLPVMKMASYIIENFNYQHIVNSGWKFGVFDSIVYLLVGKSFFAHQQKTSNDNIIDQFSEILNQVFDNSSDPDPKTVC
ncbi:hypothetical protein KAR91_22115 [Candidatus Pacearchaeota archaeon]|nr:hypothetical protein [Candidatus Pacearchaeota archaeon]